MLISNPLKKLYLNAYEKSYLHEGVIMYFFTFQYGVLKFSAL